MTLLPGSHSYPYRLLKKLLSDWGQPSTEENRCLKEGQMMYFVTKIQMGEAIDFTSQRGLWDGALHSIEELEAPIRGRCWRLWVQGEVLNRDHARLYSLNGKWQEIDTAVSVIPCLAVQFSGEEPDGEHLYLAAPEREAVSKLIAILEAFYEVEETSVDSLILANDFSRVLSCEFLDPERGDTTLVSYGQFVTVKQLLEVIRLENILAINVLPVVEENGARPMPSMVLDRRSSAAWCAVETNDDQDNLAWLPDIIRTCQRSLSVSPEYQRTTVGL
jgi:hypothetical protein